MGKTVILGKISDSQLEGVRPKGVECRVMGAVGLGLGGVVVVIF